MPTQTDEFSTFMQSVSPWYSSPVKKEFSKEELEKLNKIFQNKPKTYLEAKQNSENPYSLDYYKKIAEEKRIKKETDKKERLVDRTERIANDELRRKNGPQKEETWRESFYNDVNASDAKYRVSQEDNLFDDYINPAVMIGNMVKNLGQAPLIAKETDSNMPYVTAVATPLAVGAVGGIGAKTSSQAFNNVVNPLAGFKNPLKKSSQIKNASDNILQGVDYSYNKPGLINKEELNKLRKELADNGILKQQKTINWPWKNPIDKGIEPWGYEMKNLSTISGNRVGDVFRSFVGGKNPKYISKEDYFKLNGENLRRNYRIIYRGSTDEEIEELIKNSYEELPKTFKEAINKRYNSRYTNPWMMSRNRYSTWEMYLGKPQTKNPMYDVSPLTSKTNDVIYTIKPKYMNEEWLNDKFGLAINSIEGTEFGKLLADKHIFKKINDNEWLNIDIDQGYFGTMGGFNWKARKLNNGNYEFIASDVWDLQPFKTNNKLGPFKNIEVGKALGIGKPLNVKVGFEVDAGTKKIIKTFGTPGALMSAKGLDNNKE